MKREKRLTKKEKKAQERTTAPRGGVASTQGHHHGHIHCIACGKHLDPDMFGEADGAVFTRCDHGSDFPHCIACTDKAKALIQEHDASGKPVQSAPAWH
jgi:hypothetical protein